MQFYNSSSNTSSFAVANLSVVQIGCVAEYLPESIGDTAWADTSGNGLNGTISGAVATNASKIFGGDLLPALDNSGHDLGSSSKRWANLHVGDVQLNNQGSGGNDVDGTEGKWTIQEGEDELFIINRKNGKKYKFKLEEVE